jgi:CHRD domain
MFVKTASRKHLIAIFGGLLPLVLAAPAVAEPPDAKNFVSHLNGAEEVPERDCQGQGQAVYQLSKDGLELKYRLISSNINNVVAAHIHIGPLGVNGPVVLFLFGSPPVPPGGGAQNGILGEGTATAANLVGPLTGQPLSALVANMRAGNTYTNVHTNDGVAPTNTGCGDFPGGEIRGQIEVAGPQQ